MTEFIPPGTRFHALPSPFPFKRGGALHGARVAYETWGTLAADASNAILIVTPAKPPPTRKGDRSLTGVLRASSRVRSSITPS